ncbi:hypothetical protein FSP39_003591 [Pinctada imbricata]|uniref:Methyltransferase FkbM domain-containing protein n=1 Tax=Pinctada imbricata TaxID=66713 RepID=A0AA89C4K7_PINIB|nr:hypothetical protein FSP39_003591 [Pinctada imbricata]
MNKKSFRHSDKVFFHDTGISGKDYTDKNWRLRRLSSIKKELNHTNVRKIDILKIDTEGAEWDALVDMYHTGELGKIPQILLEFHLRTIPPVAKMEEFTKESYLRALSIIREMNNIGYKIFYNLQTHNCAFISKCSKMRRTNCVDVGFILRN